MEFAERMKKVQKKAGEALRKVWKEMNNRQTGGEKKSKSGRKGTR